MFSICIRKAEIVMGIKRNKVEEPQWTEWDYAEESKHGVFSRERWGKTVDWDIILKQVEKTRQASQMIDIHLYPSILFFNAIDLLEANLYMIDDMFYYLTGIRLIGTKPRSEQVRNKLGFWNMDCYKVLEQVQDRLIQAKAPLIECLKRGPSWGVTLKVLEKAPIYKQAIRTSSAPNLLIDEELAYIYARKHYEVDQIDQEALANQIVNILNLAEHYAYFFYCIYGDLFDFLQLLALFKQSEKAQSDYIEPWLHDFNGTRDSLIAKMEKDQKLGPWVHKYDHLSKGKDVFFQLFYDEKTYTGPINKDECYNTDNWISILTVASVLQEYDEQKNKPIQNEEELVDKLSLYFKDDDIARRFLKSVRDMKADTEIITLVKKHRDAKTCTDTSKKLWKILHDENIYKAKYRNWMDQLKW